MKKQHIASAGSIYSDQERAKIMKLLVIDSAPIQNKFPQYTWRHNEREEFHVTLKNSGVDGLKELLRRRDIDVVLLGASLPNALGILKEIRHRYEQLPVVVLVAGSMSDETMEKFKLAGADDFIPLESIAMLLVHVVWSASRKRFARLKVYADVKERYEQLDRISAIR